MQVTGYLPSTNFNCVTATYNKDKYSTVPLFSGNVLTVYNYAVNDQGVITNNRTQQKLCAPRAGQLPPGEA